MRKLVYYVGTTLDGFIAGPGGETDFFPVGQDVLDYIVAEYPETLPAHVRAAMGVTAPSQRFDTIIMGRATYDPGLKEGITSPYSNLRQYVVSASLGESPDPEVTLVPSDPLETVRRLKAENGLDIYFAGGGQLAGTLCPEIDELVVKVYPVLAHEGIPMFRKGFEASQLRLTGTRHLSGGTAVLTYTPHR